MAINLELEEQKMTFESGAANILYHPARCVIAGKIFFYIFSVVVNYLLSYQQL